MAISETFEQMFKKRFGRSPTQEELIVLIDQSVTSFNQSGGITAHTVNFGKTARSLSTGFKESLTSQISKDKLVKIDAPIGDGEALQFAQEVWNFLVYQGYRMSPGGISQSISIPTPQGQALNFHSEQGVVKVIIGHN